MKSTIYTERVDNLMRDLDEQELDCLVIFSDIWRPGNVYYTTGFSPACGGVSQSWEFLFLAKGLPPQLVVGFELVLSAESIVDSSVKVISSLEIENTFQALATHLDKNATIGIVGMDFLYTEFYLQLQHHFPKAKLVDAAEVLNKYRRFKSDEELRKIKDSHRITDAAIKVTMEAIQEGRTEREIAAIGMAKIHELGGLLGFYPTIGAGDHSAFAMQLPTYNKIKRDDMILIDFGVNYKGYFSDCSRTAGYHLKTEEKRRIITTCIEAKHEAMKLIKPGVVNCEIERCIRSVITEAGFGDYILHDSGHGIGNDQEESYVIHVNSDTVLQPRMLFTVEPGIYLPGVGGCRIEEMVYVTETGYGIFSELKDEWFIES